MRKDLVQIVCCPVHKTPLKLTVAKKDDHDDILEGTLRCAECRFDYPIEDGIPNLLPPEYHVDEVKAKKAAPTPKGKVAKESVAPVDAQGDVASPKTGGRARSGPSKSRSAAAKAGATAGGKSASKPAKGKAKA